jgi:hypothetical protein
MFTLIVGIVVGALIGWYVPKPTWVVKIENEVDKYL